MQSPLFFTGERTMAKWSVDLNKFTKATKDKILDVRKTFAFLIYSSVVKKTPVDTGRARGNWLISVNNPSKANTSRIDKRKTGAEPSETIKQEEKAKLEKAKGDESIYISNNLEYISALEYGHSKQAPSGMVGVTLANAESYWNKAVVSIKEKK